MVGWLCLMIYTYIIGLLLHLCIYTGMDVLLQVVKASEQTPSQAIYDSDSMHFNLWKKTKNNGIAKPKTLSQGWGISHLAL